MRLSPLRLAQQSIGGPSGPPQLRGGSPSGFLSRLTGVSKTRSSESKAINSAVNSLPPTVNTPDRRIKHFPKALDPDRAYIYSKKIEKTRKPMSMGFRIFNICGYATCVGIAYWMWFVRDWDDRVWGATHRRNRLKRLALHRDLTAEEAAILARPEPVQHEIPGPRWIFTQISLNFAIQKEIRKARRAQYAENQRLEKEGLDVPVTGLKINWARYGLDPAIYPMYQEGVDETMDWGAVLLEEEQ